MNKPAYSLIFAFIYMLVIMLIAASTAENFQERLIYYKNMEKRDQAKYSAQSAAENGILAMKDYDAGYEVDLTEESFCLDADSDATCESWGNFTIYAEAQENDNPDDTSGYYYTPIPGTGTAGDPDTCSIQDDDKVPDDPCNWNKLLYGDSVTIPLYDTHDPNDSGIGDDGEIMTPADLGFNEWYLRVRTPCSDGTSDEDCTRYELDEEGDVEGGDTVIFWQLIGEEDTNGDGLGDTTVSLVPEDATETVIFTEERISDLNTEIYEQLINNATSNDYTVLKASDNDPYKEIYNTTIKTDLSTLSLQLNIVTLLKEKYNTGNSIPYLEWQLVINSFEPFADNKAVIIGEGYAKGQERTFYHRSLITRYTTGENINIYTLSN